ncbi:diguanylate cyclase [Methylobacter sp. BBA5.1]|uniref:GGDEF domain-containing response regulator n=1 Tax=Methylobacter sp. BBA5.1 TaxID=1495064 RepID=UPI00068C4F10|nr:diguanylate cyclase [Methylobacter sp. BBA5.1]
MQNSRYCGTDANFDIDTKIERILIIDDSSVSIDLLRASLEPEFKIFTALNGQSGYEIAKFEQPDLILLDINIPEFNGYQTCNLLKSDPDTQAIPIIFMTALMTEESEARSLMLGGADTISKNTNVEIIKLRIKNQIELKRCKDLLERLSTTDELTGLANRRRLNEFLYQEWRNMMRAKNFLSVVLIDIDYFKDYNDHYGHILGDCCLKQVAQVFQETLSRPVDFVARYGGEEFICVLPMTAPAGAEIVGERLRNAVMRQRIPHQRSSIADVVTVSLGTATAIPDPGIDAGGLIDCADKALYQSKNNGRNRVTCIRI